MWAEDKEKDSTNNCKVAIRVRPLFAQEKLLDNTYCLECDTLRNVVVLPGQEKSYQFDKVLGPTSLQKEVYESCVEPLVQSIFEGYNATVLAYGQTGSGKTYTMGSASYIRHDGLEVGIIPRVIFRVYEEIVRKRDELDFSVTCSFLEIYNEEIRDLLDPETVTNPLTSAAASTNPASSGTAAFGRSALKDTAKSIRISEDPQTHQIMVVGATTLPAERAEDLLACLDRGCVCRSTGATQMNAVSSRSHAIFTISITQKSKAAYPPTKKAKKDNDADMEGQGEAAEGIEADGMPPPPPGPEDPTIFDFRMSKFHFVDLAGSERVKRTQATGGRLKEGIHINAGLLALGNVICALTEEPSADGAHHHVPYRDSKLTRILQDSLGGNSKTVMIACVSGSQADFAETYNTIKYASRARNIKNTPVINRDPTAALIEGYRQQILQLTNQLMLCRRADAKRRLSGLPEEPGVEYGEARGPSGMTLSELEDRMKAMTGQLRRAEDDRSAAERGRGAVAAQLEALREWVEERGMQVPDEVIADKENTLKRGLEDVHALMEQKRALEYQVQDLRSRLDSTQHRLDDAHRQLADKSSTADNLQTELAEYKRRLALFKTTLASKKSAPDPADTAQKDDTTLTGPAKPVIHHVPRSSSFPPNPLEQQPQDDATAAGGGDEEKGDDKDEDDTAIEGEVGGGAAAAAKMAEAERRSTVDMSKLEALGLSQDEVDDILNAPPEEQSAALGILEGCSDALAEEAYLRDNLRHLDNSIGQNETLLQGYKAENKNWDLLFSGLVSQITDLQTQLREMEYQREEMKAKMDKLKKTNREKDQTELKKIEVSFQQTMRKVDDYRRQIAQLQRERDSMHRKKAESDGQIAKLSNDLTKLKQERAKTAKRLQEQERKHRDILQKKEQTISQLKRREQRQRAEHQRREDRDRQHVLTLRKKNEELSRRMRVMELMQERRIGARRHKQQSIVSASPTQQQQQQQPGITSTTTGSTGTSNILRSQSGALPSTKSKRGDDKADKDDIEDGFTKEMKAWLRSVIEGKVKWRAIEQQLAQLKKEEEELADQMCEQQKHLRTVELSLQMHGGTESRMEVMWRQWNDAKDQLDTYTEELSYKRKMIRKQKDELRNAHLSEEDILKTFQQNMDFFAKIFLEELLDSRLEERGATNRVIELEGENQEIQTLLGELKKANEVLKIENQRQHLDLQKKFNEDKLLLMDWALRRNASPMPDSTGPSTVTGKPDNRTPALPKRRWLARRGRVLFPGALSGKAPPPSARKFVRRETSNESETPNASPDKRKGGKREDRPFSRIIEEAAKKEEGEAEAEAPAAEEAAEAAAEPKPPPTVETANKKEGEVFLSPVSVSAKPDLPSAAGGDETPNPSEVSGTPPAPLPRSPEDEEEAEEADEYQEVVNASTEEIEELKERAQFQFEQIELQRQRIEELTLNEENYRAEKEEMDMQLAQREEDIRQLRAQLEAEQAAREKEREAYKKKMRALQVPGGSATSASPPGKAHYPFRKGFTGINPSSPPRSISPWQQEAQTADDTSASRQSSFATPALGSSQASERKDEPVSLSAAYDDGDGKGGKQRSGAVRSYETARSQDTSQRGEEEAAATPTVEGEGDDGPWEERRNLRMARRSLSDPNLNEPSEAKKGSATGLPPTGRKDSKLRRSGEAQDPQEMHRRPRPAIRSSTPVPAVSRSGHHHASTDSLDSLRRQHGGRARPAKGPPSAIPAPSRGKKKVDDRSQQPGGEGDDRKPSSINVFQRLTKGLTEVGGAARKWGDEEAPPASTQAAPEEKHSRDLSSSYGMHFVKTRSGLFPPAPRPASAAAAYSTVEEEISRSPHFEMIIKRPQAHEYHVLSICFDTDHEFGGNTSLSMPSSIFSGSLNCVKQWDMSTAMEEPTWEYTFRGSIEKSSQPFVRCLKPAENGKLLVAAIGSFVKVFDIRAPSDPVLVWYCGEKAPTSVQTLCLLNPATESGSQLGMYVAASCHDGYIRLFDIRNQTKQTYVLRMSTQSGKNEQLALAYLPWIVPDTESPEQPPSSVPLPDHTPSRDSSMSPPSDTSSSATPHSTASPSPADTRNRRICRGLVTAGRNHTVRLWSESWVSLQPPHYDSVMCLGMLPTDDMAVVPPAASSEGSEAEPSSAAAGREGGDGGDGERERPPRGGVFVASGGKDKHIRSWYCSRETRQSLGGGSGQGGESVPSQDCCYLNAHTSCLSSFARIPGRSLLLSSDRDGYIKCWQYGWNQSSSQAETQPGPSGNAARLSLKPLEPHLRHSAGSVNQLIACDRFFVSASNDRSLKIWRPLAETEAGPAPS
ncbi:unnamed protein product [Vitrella brassicaformis CCMP3155]|uniref:Kinesin motor domain-containing protein n=7 Tax=Vitrella brassicaformis TaxID=1169539 RepID=A0A0G4GS15_VITBC|nr:unnamed protein product [Vitrella brassicaformis CCMP3155]|eukprot:CEM33404.1 unnamed protein product [Vitrella brassicaformis CCMP3155]